MNVNELTGQHFFDARTLLDYLFHRRQSYPGYQPKYAESVLKKRKPP